MKKIANFSQKILANLKKNHIKARFWSLTKALIFIGLAVGVTGFFGLTVYAAWISRDLPDPNSLSTREIPQSTKIYDRTGTKLLYEIHGDEKRTLIKIEEIPDYARQATIAIEDKDFYNHSGIYWRGLVRAVLVNTLQGQRISGTSTLTQQLVKNAVLTNERSLTRKLKELILSLQLERRFSKDQILQLYFNEIPYGSTVYGIESAAQTFFGKPAKELTLDEAALLASIPQRPTYFSPYNISGHERLTIRQNYVLDLMADQDYISQEQAEEAKAIDTLKKVRPRKVGDINAPHFVDYVREFLVTQYGAKTIEQGGLSVITTLDWDKQQIAEEEVKKGVDERGARFGFKNAALVSLDPKTGQILAMVGSKDFFDDSIDGQVNVTLRPRQPGSSFKPIVYAAAFARGYTPQTKVWDVNTVFKTDGRNYEPKNYSLKENGPVSLRQALAGSLNIPAVQVLYLVGIGRAMDFAESLGYTTFGDRSRFGLSLVLGGAEVKPLEHAAAFSVFANDGKQVPTASILKITDPNGKVLSEWTEPESRQAVDPQVARLLTDVMSDNNARAFIFGARNSLTLADRQVAAKTGTTNEFKDAWTAGFTPNHVAVVWVGNSQGEEMRRGADGSVVAAPIWQNYMRRAVQGMPKETFKAPAPVQSTKLAILGTAFEDTARINRVTGKLASEFTPPDLIEERKGYSPHSILHYIDKDDPLGPAPSDPARDPQYWGWENAVQSWVKRAGADIGSVLPTEFDDQYTAESRPQITLYQPLDGQEISSRSFTIQADVIALRSVRRLEAFLDGNLVGASFGAPWTIRATVPNWIENGSRTLTVAAIDDIGNRNQVSIGIRLVAERAPEASLLLISPASGTTWSRSTFPKNIQLSVDDPGQYARLYASLISVSGEEIHVGSVDNPQSNTSIISLPAGPMPGVYTLKIIGTRTDGTSLQLASSLIITD